MTGKARKLSLSFLRKNLSGCWPVYTSRAAWWNSSRARPSLRFASISSGNPTTDGTSICEWTDL